jgi:hypothetical protein
MKFDGFDVKKSTTKAIKEHQRRKNFTLITQIIFLMQISQIKQMVLIPQKNKKTIWTTRTIKKRCP